MRFSLLTPVVSAALIAAQALAQTPAPGSDRPAPGTPATAPSAPAVQPLPSSDVPETAVVLAVGSIKFTRAQYEQLLKAMPENIRSQAMGPARRQVAEQVAELEALAQEASKRKIDQRPEVKEITALQINQMLAGFLVQDLKQNATPDAAAVQTYYDAHKEDYQEARISHILIRYKGSRVPLKKDAKDLTPEEALAKATDIKKKIDGGADFATEAKAESDDPGSAPNGGELGFATRGQFVPEFSKAAFALPAGQVSDPVKTPFGYHIIKVIEFKYKPVDEVRATIEQHLKNDMAQKEIDTIRAQSGPMLNDAYFGKAANVPSLMNPGN